MLIGRIVGAGGYIIVANSSRGASFEGFYFNKGCIDELLRESVLAGLADVTGWKRQRRCSRRSTCEERRHVRTMTRYRFMPDARSGDVVGTPFFHHQHATALIF